MSNLEAMQREITAIYAKLIGIEESAASAEAAANEAKAAFSKVKEPVDYSSEINRVESLIKPYPKVVDYSNELKAIRAALNDIKIPDDHSMEICDLQRKIREIPDQIDYSESIKDLLDTITLLSKRVDALTVITLSDVKSSIESVVDLDFVNKLYRVK